MSIKSIVLLSLLTLLSGCASTFKYTPEADA